MSNYSRALERLQREYEDKFGAPKSVGEQATTAKRNVASSSASGRSAHRQRLEESFNSPRAGRGTAYAALLDDLRALAKGADAPAVVIAGASGHESIQRISYGLARQAEDRKLRVLVTELAPKNGRPFLLSRPMAPGTHTTKEVVFSPPSEGVLGESPYAAVSSALEKWFTLATLSNDLVLVEGPPLSSSVDAALLARSADGIIIAVEPQLTPRDALQTAVERAQTVGCTVLGLVMTGTREWLPRWLRRLLRGSLR